QSADLTLALIKKVKVKSIALALYYIHCVSNNKSVINALILNQVAPEYYPLFRGEIPSENAGKVLRKEFNTFNSDQTNRTFAPGENVSKRSINNSHTIFRGALSVLEYKNNKKAIEEIHREFLMFYKNHARSLDKTDYP